MARRGGTGGAEEVGMSRSREARSIRWGRACTKVAAHARTHTLAPSTARCVVRGACREPHPLHLHHRHHQHQHHPHHCGMSRLLAWSSRWSRVEGLFGGEGRMNGAAWRPQDKLMDCGIGGDAQLGCPAQCSCPHPPSHNAAHRLRHSEDGVIGGCCADAMMASVMWYPA